MPRTHLAGAIPRERLDRKPKLLLHQVDENRAQSTAQVGQQAKRRVLNGVEVDDIVLERAGDVARGAARLAQQRVADEVQDRVPEVHDGAHGRPYLLGADEPEWRVGRDGLAGALLAQDEVGDGAEEGEDAKVGEEDAVGFDHGAVFD